MSTSSIAQTVQLYDALHRCIEQHAPMSILYATKGTITKQRIIHPLEIVVGTCGADKVWAHDSLRGDILSFWLDRFVAYAPVNGVA